jgi:outer membrane scaffolding protein for murein synthesis (MipA/OmpV family)
MEARHKRAAFQPEQRRKTQMKDRKRLLGILVGLSIVCLMVPMTQAADYSVGAGVGLAPDYEGSGDYEAVPIPYGQILFDNGMYVQLQGLKLKANLLPSNTWRLGPVYNYRSSRSVVDNSQVDDMKNVSDANELGAFGGVKIENWFAEVMPMTGGMPP